MLQRLREHTVEVVLGLLLGGLVGWGTWTTNISFAHGNRITKVETQIESTQENIKDVKDSLHRIEDKLDKVMEKQ